MKKIFSLFILLLPLFLTACGKGIVEATNESYEPRLVIEGLLIAGEKVDQVRVSRNFRLDADLSETAVVINNAEVKILDVSARKIYSLTFCAELPRLTGRCERPVNFIASFSSSRVQSPQPFSRP